MDGRTLAGRLRAQRPGVRVLFPSGYPAELIGASVLLEAGDRCLLKPFSPQELAAALRAALAADQPVSAG